MLGVVLGLWQPDAFQEIANVEIEHVNIINETVQKIRPKALKQPVQLDYFNSYL